MPGLRVPDQVDRGARRRVDVARPRPRLGALSLRRRLGHRLDHRGDATAEPAEVVSALEHGDDAATGDIVGDAAQPALIEPLPVRLGFGATVGGFLDETI